MMCARREPVSVLGHLYPLEITALGKIAFRGKDAMFRFGTVPAFWVHFRPPSLFLTRQSAEEETPDSIRVEGFSASAGFRITKGETSLRLSVGIRGGLLHWFLWGVAY